MANKELLLPLTQTHNFKKFIEVQLLLIYHLYVKHEALIE